MDVQHIEGRREQDFTLTATDVTQQPQSFRCRLESRYSTGERWHCGTSHPYFELLHTFGRDDAAIIEHGPLKPDNSKDRVFYSCRAIENKNMLSTVSCDREPKHPDPIDENKLISPILSTIDKIKIPNAHQVGDSGWVFRSMSPRTQENYDSIREFRFRNVLIFKSGNKKEISDEIERLDNMGVVGTNIPFDWKDHKNFREPCRQTVQALQQLVHSMRRQHKILFHCTVGEDRTGYLAAIFRMITEPKANPRELFIEEMCERGYDLGDAYKPYFNVAKKIRDATTVLYLKMAEKVRKGELSLQRLDPKICNRDVTPTLSFNNFKCKTSTRFRPVRY